MCGMIHVIRKDGHPAYKVVLKRYRKQKERGISGFGYVAIKDNQIVSYQRAETEHEIIKLISQEKAPEIMFHHRQPTGTPNMTELAHPFLIENEMLEHQYFVQHNGVIRNSSELKEKHEKLGFEYSSELARAYVTRQGEQYINGYAWNDSESIAIETALALDGKKDKIDTEGAAAVMGLQTKGKQVINRFFYRNVMNPLKYHEDKQMIAITSAGAGEEVKSLVLYRIKQGGGYEVFPGGIEPPFSYKSPNTSYDWRTKKEKKEDAEKEKAKESKEVTVYRESRVGRYLDKKSGAWVEYPIDSRRMGFLDGGMRKVNDLLGFPPLEDDIDYQPPDDTPDYQGMVDDLEADPLTDSRQYEVEALLKSMDLNDLWKEHDLTLGKIDEMEKELAVMEERAKLIITLEQLSRSEELKGERDELRRWIDTLFKEITWKNGEADLTVDERLMK